MGSELLSCPTPEIAPEEWQRTPPSVQQRILQMAQRLLPKRLIPLYRGNDILGKIWNRMIH
jgi:hypothetical protein